MWLLARINFDDTNWKNWILLGIVSGLCIMSKVHGVFIWGGLMAYIVFVRRNWLINPRLYLSAFIALAIASPILIWNIENKFVTYHFHVQRVLPNTFSLSWLNFLREFLGEAIINNIFNVWLIFVAVVAFMRRRIKHSNVLALYNFIGLPLLLSVLFISLYRHTFPHWNGPAYITLIPIAAIYLSEKHTSLKFPSILKCSLGLYIIFLVTCTAEIKCYPGNFGKKTKPDLGKGDITLDMNGWSAAGKRFGEIYKTEILRGKATPSSPVVCYKWWGSHIEYYFCRPFQIPMIGLGTLDDLHQYAWLNSERLSNANFNTAYCIVPTDENYNVYEQYKNYYSTVESIAVIEIIRSHVPTHNFHVFRLTGWKGSMPLSK
jgi:hypothetical protein